MNIFKNTLVALILVFGLLQHQNAFAQEMQERKMTVQELAASLEENNIQLKLANTSVQAAIARIGEVKTNRLPDFGADMSGMYLGDVHVYNPNWEELQKVDMPNFGHQFNVSANQLIYAGGKVNKAVQLAEMNKALTEDQRDDTEQSVKLNAAQLFLNLYNLQNQKRILESNKELAHERTKNAQQFFDQKMITENEVLRAELLERQLEQSILQVQNAILITNKNLTLFAGLDENILIVPDVSNLDHQIREQDEAYFRQLAYQSNPRFSASNMQISMAKKNLQLTKAERLPVLAGFAGYNATRPMTSASPILDLYSNNHQVGLSISYNIASLYKTRKKTAVDQIMIQQAQQGQIAVQQQIESEVNTAYKNYHLAVEQREVSAINESAADENYRITESKYQNQLITLIEMIDASNTKLQAELQTLDDETEIILNYVKLLRASGQL